MAQIGNAHIDSLVVEVWEQESGLMFIDSGGDQWMISPDGGFRGPAGNIQMAVEALVRQGYTIAAHSGRKYTLQKSDESGIDSAGNTSHWHFTQVTAGGEKVKTGGCFIATACYGNYDHPDVLVLRQWRDEILMPHAIGRAFVHFYYTVSPPCATQIKRIPAVSAFIRKAILEPLARKLKK